MTPLHPSPPPGKDGPPLGGRVDCRQAQALSARGAAGPPLDAAEAAALRAHRVLCADCQADWALDTALPLRDADDSGPALPLSPVAQGRFVAVVLAGARGAITLAPAPRPKRLAWALAAGLFAAAAAAAVVLSLGAPEQRPAAAPSGFVARTVLGPVWADGVAVRSGAALPAGATLTTGPAGRAALALADGTALHLGPASRLTLPAAAAADTTLRLEAGAVLATVAPQPAGRVLAVATPAGRVEVVGTTFTVEVAADGAAVRVIEGVVRVHDGPPTTAAAAPPRTVQARQATAIRAGATPADVRPLTAAEVRTDLGLVVDDAARTAALAAALAAAPPEPAPAAARADRRSRNAADAARSRAAHPRAEAPTEKAPAARTSPPDGANRWLREARRLRTARDWEGAAAAYEALVAASPASATARAARVSHGDLLLEHLDDARGALASFDAYLAAAPDGALAEEALWGRARALRALGRSAEERAALEALLAHAPTGPVAARARVRLAELTGR